MDGESGTKIIRTERATKGDKERKGDKDERRVR